MKNSYVSRRINEIDFIRGLLLLLMIFDHFFLLYQNLSIFSTGIINSELLHFSSYYLSNSIRKSIRIVVICLFFAVSGISCNFSRNNNKRSFKLFISSVGFTLITFFITKFTSYNCLVLCGVLHCYTLYVIIYCFIKNIFEKEKIVSINIILLFFIISLFFIIFDFKIKNSNLLIYLGIPSKNYIAPFEYVSPPKYLWVFFVGVLLGKSLYSNHKNSYLKIRPPIISWIGKKSIWFYFLHFPIIALCIIII